MHAEDQDIRLQALGEMASGVLHDLNQSLAIVTGFLDLAQQALDDNNAELVRRRIRLAAQAANGAAASTQRFLGGARPTLEANQSVAIGRMLHEIAELTSPRWGYAAQVEGRTIRVRVETAPGLFVAGESYRLRAALMNLVFNAVDALPLGGEIALVARRDGERIAIEIADTGQGMPEEVLARCFEPFFTTKGSASAGLGLAQVIATVRQHSGRIEVDSAEGRGTRFRLSLPASSATDAQRTGAAPS
jgi:signal transduction histidine kinase